MNENSEKSNIYYYREKYEGLYKLTFKFERRNIMNEKKIYSAKKMAKKIQKKVRKKSEYYAKIALIIGYISEIREKSEKLKSTYDGDYWLDVIDRLINTDEYIEFSKLLDELTAFFTNIDAICEEPFSADDLEDSKTESDSSLESETESEEVRELKEKFEKSPFRIPEHMNFEEFLHFLKNEEISAAMHPETFWRMVIQKTNEIDENLFYEKIENVEYIPYSKEDFIDALHLIYPNVAELVNYANYHNHHSRYTAKRKYPRTSDMYIDFLNKIRCGNMTVGDVSYITGFSSRTILMDLEKIQNEKIKEV